MPAVDSWLLLCHLQMNLPDERGADVRIAIPYYASFPTVNLRSFCRTVAALTALVKMHKTPHHMHVDTPMSLPSCCRVVGDTRIIMHIMVSTKKVTYQLAIVERRRTRKHGGQNYNTNISSSKDHPEHWKARQEHCLDMV